MSMRTFLEYVQAGNYKKTPESLHTYRLQEAGKNWIQKANIKKGALHKELGIPEDEKIPTGKLTGIRDRLSKAAEGDKTLDAKDSRLLKRVNLALSFRKMND
jgi:hypothetical protein